MLYFNSTNGLIIDYSIEEYGYATILRYTISN